MKKTALVITLLVVFAAGNVWASGFRIPEQGAAAMGMANAWVATADDASAVSINPAGITQLGTPSVAGGFLIITPTVDFSPEGGGDSVAVEDNVFFPPNVYGTCNMGTTNWFFGIGVSAPFGLGTEWADDSFARYVSTNTELQVINVNPTLAYKVSENFSIGIGADYYYSNALLEKQVPWGMMSYGYTGDASMLAIADGSFKLDGDGDGWGWNAGALFRFGEGNKYALGLAYRSGVTVDYEGDADLEDIGGIGQMLYGSTSFSTTGNLELDYPDMFQVGFAAQVMPQLKIEFDVEWTGWSSYEELALEFEAGIDDETLEKNWDDTITYRVGAEYAVSEAVDVRLGYLFDESPIPDESYDTLLPDGDKRHGVSVGFGYKQGAFSVDAAYLALWLTEREISGNTTGQPYTDINGTYDGFTHLFALNLSYMF